MAKITYTVDQIITTIRNRGMVPNVASLGTTDADLIRVINEEMLNELVPAIMKVKEDYFVSSRRDALVASQTRYRLPTRAVGQILKDILYVDTSGNRFQMGAPVSRHSLDGFNYNASSSPAGYYIEGNYIVLVPVISPAFTGSIETAFFIRPGQLVTSTEFSVISAVNTTTKVVTLSAAIPSTFTTSATYDIHSPSSGAELKLYDLTASAAAGTSVTFGEAIDGSTFGTYAPAVGDYLCLAGEAALPSLPQELHATLAQAALVRILKSLGDFEMAQVEQQTMDRQLVAAGYMVGQRVEAKARKINSRAFTWGRC